MVQNEKNGLSEELEALRKSLEELPSADDDEQKRVLSALDELMGSLTRLTETVEAIRTKTDD